MKLTDAFEGYWLDKRLTMSETTIPGYEKTFGRLRDFLGDVEMESITANDVRRFLDAGRNLPACGGERWLPIIL